MELSAYKTLFLDAQHVSRHPHLISPLRVSGFPLNSRESQPSPVGRLEVYASRRPTKQQSNGGLSWTCYLYCRVAAKTQPYSTVLPCPTHCPVLSTIS